jgi:photosystem II stability/assembly factor-like uncharacterized protein
VKIHLSNFSAMKNHPLNMKAILFFLVSLLGMNFLQAQWSLQYSNNSGAGLHHIKMVNATVGYACDTKFAYKTSNGGTTWAKIDSLVYNNVISAIHAVSANDIYILYSSGNGFQAYVKYSANGGTSWTQQAYFGVSGELYNAMYFTSITTGYVCGNSGKIYKTTNSGASWTQQTSGTSNSLQEVEFPSATTGYIVGQGPIVLKTTNGGTTWSNITGSIPSALEDMNFTSVDTGIIAGFSGLHRTTNGGASWTNVLGGTFYAVDYGTKDTLYAAAPYGYIAASYDKGVTWDTLNQAGMADIDFVSGLTGHGIAGGTKIYKTTVGAYSCPVVSFGSIPALYCDSSTFTINAQSNWATNAATISFSSSANAGIVSQSQSGPNANASVMMTQSGSNAFFYVTLNASALGCPTAYDTVSIADVQNNYTPVYPQPTNAQFACVGDTLHMGSGAYSYQWGYPGNILSTNEYLVVTQAMIGSMFQFSATTCAGSTMQYMWLQQDTGCAPPSSCNILAVANSDITYCGNVPAQFQLISTGSGSWNYVSWSPQTYLSNVTSPVATLTPPPGITINMDYIVTYSDTTNGCQDSDTIHVFAADQIIETVYNCNSSPLVLSANSGASSYYWSPGGSLQQFFTVNSPGLYFCQETHANGCFISHYFTVVDSCSPPPCNTAVYAGTDIFSCGNPPSTISLNSTGNNFNQVSWSPTTYLSNANSMVATFNTPAGVAVSMDYVVTYNDTTNGCTDSDTIHVQVAALINQTIYNCNNSPVVLSANSGALSYNWFPTNGNNQALTVTAPGSYYCQENNGNGCVLTHSFYVVDSCNSVPCSYSVNAGPSVFYCAGSVSNVPTFSASVTPSSVNYTYQWSPSTGLSDPNILNPTVANVYNQIYTLTVIDSANNCSVSDTVMATSLPYTAGTVYNCNGSPLTIYNPPGAYYYQWMGGFNPQPSTFQNSTIITQPGQYYYAAYYQGCAVTNSILLVDSCGVQIPNVWPGDCNYDLTADYLDFLNIAMAYGYTGATRPGASIAWTAQPMADWATASYSANDKHSDCNGDGVVDITDAQAIIANYNNVHPFKLATPQNVLTNADLYLVADKDTAILGETVVFSIYLGKPSLPVDSIYALAYQLKYDEPLTDNVGNVVYINSWLGTPGTNEVSLEKQLPVDWQIDCGVGGNDHLNRTGQGKIAEVTMIVTTDNLSGIQYLNADLQGVWAVTSGGNNIPLNLAGDSVYIDWTQAVGLIQADFLNNLVSVYPNPSKEEVYVNCGKVKVNSIVVYDMTGNIADCAKQVSNGNTTRLSGLARGVYNLSVQTEKGTVNKKLVIQ